MNDTSNTDPILNKTFALGFICGAIVMFAIGGTIVGRYMSKRGL